MRKETYIIKKINRKVKKKLSFLYRNTKTIYEKDFFCINIKFNQLIKKKT